MSKKSDVLNAGREFVMNMAKEHGLDKTALHFGYVRSNGTGNGGALSNVIKELGWRSEGAKNGDNGVKPASASVATLAPAKAHVIASTALPARIEEWMLDNMLPAEWQDDDGRLVRSIPQHFVELVVLSDTPDWNKRVRRLGVDEITMLEAFLGAPCTMNRREDALLAKRARAPFERTEATINHHARIDAGLLNAENRFEASRYDADITAFYCE